MKKQELEKRLKLSINEPCVIVKKDGTYMLCAIYEYDEKIVTYCPYNENSDLFKVSDDYMMSDIMQEDIEMSKILTVILFEEFETWHEKTEQYRNINSS